MQSFHKLVTLLALMLFASKDAIALPYPNTVVEARQPTDLTGGFRVHGGFSNTGGFANNGRFGGSNSNNGGVIDSNTGSSQIGPTSFENTIPFIPSGTAAASTIGTVGNQIGVASGNISPGSVNERDEAVVEARQPTDLTGDFRVHGGFSNTGGFANNGRFGGSNSNNGGVIDSNTGSSQIGPTSFENTIPFIPSGTAAASAIGARQPTDLTGDFRVHGGFSNTGGFVNNGKFRGSHNNNGGVIDSNTGSSQAGP